ncbi:MAG: hypothetical protein K8T20_06150 [Planctomycetes bacterium]|nr:hypothetical protein [Planctomycetota bacterium]
MRPGPGDRGDAPKRPGGSGRSGPPGRTPDYVPGTGRPGRNVPVTEIEARLFAGGRTVADFVILESGLALAKTSEGRWAAAIAADEDLSRAVTRYLRQHGARLVTMADIRNDPAPGKPS